VVSRLFPTRPTTSRNRSSNYRWYRKGVRRARRLVRAVAGLLVLALALGIVAFRRGWWAPPGGVAAAGALLALALLAELAFAVRDLAEAPGRAARLGWALLVLGLFLSMAGGAANWARSIKAFVLLVEGQEVSLDETARLPGFTAGPLLDRDELAVRLRLVKVQLRGAPGGSYVPEGEIVVTDRDGTRAVTVGPDRPVSISALRISEGAFGFAPRIVVQRNGATVLDEVVPFQSSVGEGRAVSFQGALTIASESLALEGEVDLSGLDEKMKGHPRLVITVRKDGRSIGEGQLLPGHFAELAEGYRIGFAGLDRWIELDVRRRTYRGVMLAGYATALAGLVLWGALRWRPRRRG